MQNLVFEGRTLKPYLVEVPPADLVVGHVYFRVAFIDEDMVVPQWSGLVFLGRDLEPRLPGLYFQDAESHLKGERAVNEMWASALEDHEGADGYSWVSDRIWCDWVPERSKRSGVCHFEDALDQLLKCSLRRHGWDGAVRPVAPREDPTHGD